MPQLNRIELVDLGLKARGAAWLGVRNKRQNFLRSTKKPNLFKRQRCLFIKKIDAISQLILTFNYAGDQRHHHSSFMNTSQFSQCQLN